MSHGFARKFYDSKEWRKCRAAFMSSKFYICERCGGVATVAHHKTPITPKNISDSNVILSWDNLESVCADCHNRIHAKDGATADGISFDADGNVVYTPISCLFQKIL